MSYVDLDPLSAFTSIPSTWLAQLLANTEALHDGTGFPDGAIPGSALSSSAITLGYKEITSDFVTTSTSYVDVTGLSKTVTVPDGGRRVKITVDPKWLANTVAGQGCYMQILEDGVLVREKALTSSLASGANPFTMIASKVPTAGSHTYKAQVKTDTGTMTLKADANGPCLLLIELI